MSKLIKHLEKLFNVKQLTTSGYRPQTNGSLESSHIILEYYIKHYADDYDDWDRLLPFAIFAYNTSVHEATNFIPYELVFRRVARTTSSFTQGTELETYESYLRDLIVRIIEIQKIDQKSSPRQKFARRSNWTRKFHYQTRTSGIPFATRKIPSSDTLSAIASNVHQQKFSADYLKSNSSFLQFSLTKKKRHKAARNRRKINTIESQNSSDNFS